MAAILFPAFAKAREAARRSSCSSNLKQLGIATMQYSQEYDEKYPIGVDGNYGFGFAPVALNSTSIGTWPKMLQPYLKSLGVFVCPSDPNGGSPAPLAAPSASPPVVAGDWAGINISYAANGYTAGWDGAGTPLGGVIGVAGAGTWIHSNTGNQSQARMTQPSATVLITEKFSSDWPSGGFGGVGMASAATPNLLILGENSGQDGLTKWGAHKIPDGTRVGTGYDNDVNGAVSVKHLETANFLFVDGHVKSMKPAATNPDPVGRPQDNMWNALR